MSYCQCIAALSPYGLVIPYPLFQPRKICLSLSHRKKALDKHLAMSLDKSLVQYFFYSTLKNDHPIELASYEIRF